MNDCLILPDCDLLIHPGCKVKLGRFSKHIWEVHYGWYSYGGNRPVCGWYLQSLGVTKPLHKYDLDDIYMVEQGHHHHDHPPKPEPTEDPELDDVKVYKPNTLYYEGQIVWLTSGELYQVVNDYISSSSKSTDADNLAFDIDIGKLIAVSDGEIGERITPSEIDDIIF